MMIATEVPTLTRNVGLYITPCATLSCWLISADDSGEIRYDTFRHRFGCHRARLKIILPITYLLICWICTGPRTAGRNVRWPRRCCSPHPRWVTLNICPVGQTDIRTYTDGRTQDRCFMLLLWTKAASVVIFAHSIIAWTVSVITVSQLMLSNWVNILS